MLKGVFLPAYPSADKLEFVGVGKFKVDDCLAHSFIWGVTSYDFIISNNFCLFYSLTIKIAYPSIKCCV